MERRQYLALSQSTGTALQQKIDECFLGLEGFIDVLAFIQENLRKQLSMANKDMAELQILMQNSRADLAT
jgi:hypothetical protein